MAPTNEELKYENARQRIRDQVELIRQPTMEMDNGPDLVATDTEDPADHNFLFVPGVVLVDDADVADVDALLGSRDDIPVDNLGDPVANVSGDLNVRTMLNESTDFEEVRQFLRVLDVIDEELGEGVVTPDHYLHVSADGSGRPCPATEPEETGLEGPWPTETGRSDADDNIKVFLTVVDTGWWEGAGNLSWLGEIDVEAAQLQTFPGDVNFPDLTEYGGHGTFIAGVARCRAPRSRIQHRKFLVQGGAVRESAMVHQLESAIDEVPKPHVINLSAGGHTRHGMRLKSFRRLWNDKLKNEPDVVLIAAAGNDGTADPFYPAAFTWAVGVGSLDRNGEISSFSNYGESADVYVVGRNHVNAFPIGAYVCRETPDKDDERGSPNGLARWSGTSFAAPLFAGIDRRAAHRRPQPDGPQIAWDLVNSIQEENLAPYGSRAATSRCRTGATPDHHDSSAASGENRRDPQTNRCENRSLWDTSTSKGSGTSCRTAVCCSTTCRSASVRAPRSRWSARTAPARRRCSRSSPAS